MTPPGCERSPRSRRARRGQLERLARDARFDLKALHGYLKTQHDKAKRSREPTTVAAWIDALLPLRGSAKDNSQTLRWLYGLEAPFVDQQVVRVRDVAKHKGVTTQRIYQILKSRVASWQKKSSLPALKTVARRALKAAGGVAPLNRAASGLMLQLPQDPEITEEVTRQQCAALLAMLARLSEGDDEDDEALTTRRIHDTPWIGLGPTRLGSARELGDAADRLARRVVLAAAGEVTRTFREIVSGTPLATLDDGRLGALATEASLNAARSSRFEIYPRNLDPARAIELSAQVLGGRMSAEQVRQRVRARYAERQGGAGSGPSEAIWPGIEGGRYRPIPAHGIEAIHQTALRILAEVGLASATPRCIETITAAGGSVSKAGRLLFPPELVERTLETAGRGFKLFGQRPEYDLDPSGTRIHLGTSGAAVHIVDSKTGQIRDSTLADLHDMARLAQALPNIHMFQRTVVARDIEDTHAMELNTAYACAAGTAKPIGTSFSSVATMQSAVEMFHMIAGGEQAWRARPFCCVSTCFVVPPSRLPKKRLASSNAPLKPARR